MGFARWLQPKGLSTDWELGILHLGEHQIKPWRLEMGEAQPSPVFKSSRKVPSKQGLFGAENSFCPWKQGGEDQKPALCLELPQLSCSPWSSSSRSTHHMPQEGVSNPNLLKHSIVPSYRCTR